MSRAAAQRSAVIFAPHPDDETLGCGTGIWRKSQNGTTVWIVVVTNGEAERSPLVDAGADIGRLRAEEALEAASELGVPGTQVRFLGFDDGTLADHGPDLEAALGTVIDECSPDEVLIPAILDSHPDHAAVASAVRDLVRAGRFHGHVYEYPVWYWESLPRFTLARGSGQASAFPIQLLRELIRPVRRIRSTASDRERKRAALKHYRSQIDWDEPGHTTIPLSGGFVSEFIDGDEVFFPIAEP